MPVEAHEIFDFEDPARWEESYDFDLFRQAGLTWVRFDTYHFRIAGLVDFWMPRSRWYVQVSVGPRHPFKKQGGSGALECIEMVKKIQAFLNGKNPNP